MTWHSMEKPDGTITTGGVPIEYQRAVYQYLQTPNLIAKTLVDIGAADGFYSIEFAKQGANVVAINVEEDFHNSCKDFVKLSGLQNITPRLLSVYDVDKIPQDFDIVCMMGLLYHLRNPLLALDLWAKKTKELLIVESYYIESNSPIMLFYPSDELNHDYSNWWGPSISCLEQMIQSAGFARTEVKYIDKHMHRVIIHGFV